MERWMNSRNTLERERAMWCISQLLHYVADKQSFKVSGSQSWTWARSPCCHSCHFSCHHVLPDPGTPFLPLSTWPYPLFTCVHLIFSPLSLRASLHLCPFLIEQFSSISLYPTWSRGSGYSWWICRWPQWSLYSRILQTMEESVPQNNLV